MIPLIQIILHKPSLLLLIFDKGTTMATLKMMWENFRNQTYRIYVSDNTFTENNLPNEFYTYNDSINATIDIDYASKLYVMFSVEDISGNVTYGDLIEINSFEDYITSTFDGNILSINAAFLTSLLIEVDGRSLSVCHDRASGTIFSVVYDNERNRYNFIAYDDTTGDVKWLINNFTSYVPAWNEGSPLSYSTKMMIHNGHVYVMLYDNIFIFNTYGNLVSTIDGNNTRVGYVKTHNFSDLGNTNNITFQDFCITDNGEYLYVLSNFNYIARIGKNVNVSINTFHLGNQGDDYQYLDTTIYNYSFIGSITPHNTHLCVTAHDDSGNKPISQRDALALFNFDNTTATNITTQINTINGDYSYTTSVYKNGYLYVSAIRLSSRGSIESANNIIYNLVNNTVLQNRIFSEFNDFRDILFTFSILPTDDLNVVYLSTETGLLLYNINNGELYNYAGSGAITPTITFSRKGESTTK